MLVGVVRLQADLVKESFRVKLLKLKLETDNLKYLVVNRRLVLERAGCRPHPHPTTGTTMTTTLSCGPLGQNHGLIRCIGFAPWGP